jgi:hypothetical protein
MKRYRLLFVLFTLILLALSGCSQAPATVLITPTVLPVEPTAVPVEPTDTPTAAPTLETTAELAEASPVVMTVQGLEETLTFTLEELKTLPATSGQAGMKSSTGKITVPALYKGVLLTDLTELVGGLTADLGVTIVANDGYAMTLSYDQILNGSFIVYDPSDGSEKQIDDPLQALIAYEVDGQPLDTRGEGILRMVIISPKNNQVTDGHWSVKWTERVEVHPLGREWTLSLDGVRDEVIDRNTFQSCGATSCHQSTWTDDEGQVWAGVPLYLLAGRMDDDISHEGPAFNRDLANAGYLIELIASDGYTTTIDSAAAFYNRQILVANLVNDGALPDKYFPLRLVGEDTEKGQRAGALAEIRLILEEPLEAAATEPASELPTPAPSEGSSDTLGEEPPAGTALWITGQAINSMVLNDAGIHALEVVKATAEHPKKGKEDYEGVSLNALLNLAGLQPGAATLTLSASDGYSVDVDLAAVQACSDCLLAFTETEGVYNLVMPGFESSAWVKDLVKVEIK